jgi:phosphate binding protein
MKTLFVASYALIGVALATGAEGLEVDPKIPGYQPVPVGSAQIKSVGSDTLGDLMRDWADDFTKLNPNVKFDVESKGSGTAPAALLDGVSQLGPMSRPMRSEEYEPFEKKYGYHPASIPVAVDALAVYVNKENPIECLTIEQLDQIFSKTHLYSGGKNVTTWGEAGLNGDWATHSISLFGRNSASGTHDTFVETVMRHGEFKDELKEQPGSAEVVKMVARGQVCNRIFRDRVSHGRSEDCAFGCNFWRQVLRHLASLDLLRELSALSLSVHLSEQGAGEGPGPADIGIRQIRLVAGWADRNIEERLLSHHRCSSNQSSPGARGFKRFELS